ncbi:MAG: TerC family protein [Desulfobacterales bacterium]|nr:MAG: TerC family protein [Desulfobacterales bacterium]
MNWLTDPNVWFALMTLSAIEVVLGIDNIIFIAILADKLPKDKKASGRTVGLLLAMLTRIAFLFSITLIMKLTQPLFTIITAEISGRDLILIAGGLFLLGKSTLEIHSNLEGEETHAQAEKRRKRVTFSGVIVQIMLLDIVFSIDSVITAIGLAKQLAVMIAAIVIAVIFMIFLATKISSFVENHPTIKILALSFLLLIGFSLVGEGLDLHIPKGYIYFAMAFSTFVEILNIRVRKRRLAPLKLRNPRSVKISLT